MDAEMERRWRGGLPPFDGVTVTLEDHVPLPVLRRLLLPVFDVLQARYSHAALFTFHDWHEHDGCGLDSKPGSWEELRAILASDEALASSYARDTYVRTGFLPAGREFYLRLYVPSAGDNPHYARDDPDLVTVGTFDVTCAPDLAMELVAAMEEIGGATLRLAPAREFFDARYSG